VGIEKLSGSIEKRRCHALVGRASHQLCKLQTPRRACPKIWRALSRSCLESGAKSGVNGLNLETGKMLPPDFLQWLEPLEIRLSKFFWHKRCFLSGSDWH